MLLQISQNRLPSVLLIARFRHQIFEISWRRGNPSRNNGYVDLKTASTIPRNHRIHVHFELEWCDFRYHYYYWHDENSKTVTHSENRPSAGISFCSRNMDTEIQRYMCVSSFETEVSFSYLIIQHWTKRFERTSPLQRWRGIYRV